MFPMYYHMYMNNIAVIKSATSEHKLNKVTDNALLQTVLSQTLA